MKYQRSTRKQENNKTSYLSYRTWNYEKETQKDN